MDRAIAATSDEGEAERMPRDWETQFKSWAVAPGKPEQEKIERADSQIRSAIAASSALSKRDIAVFPQGSYRNRTNVPRESDVDICVRCRDTFIYSFFPENEIAKSAAAISPATYTYQDFKNDVEAALVARFGRAAVTRGKKAFNVRETSTRVESDVIATFEFRRYTGVDWLGRATYITGTAFYPEASANYTVNWPQQHYDNGVAKNERTRERFKAMVRVLKNLRNEMDDTGIADAKPIPSYLVECLVWNVPDSRFGYTTYYAELKEVLRFLYLNTVSDDKCSEWGEVNELKYLLRGTYPWSRAQANAFVLAAWRHVGFRDD